MLKKQECKTSDHQIQPKFCETCMFLKTTHHSSDTSMVHSSSITPNDVFNNIDFFSFLSEIQYVRGSEHGFVFQKGIPSAHWKVNGINIKPNNLIIHGIVTNNLVTLHAAAFNTFFRS